MHTFINIMGVKTITIRDDVYDLLAKIKREGESFSDVILRLIRRESNIMDFFGILKESEVLEELEKDIINERKKWKLRDVYP